MARILIVEDDADTRRLIATAVRRLGHAPMPAASAEEALSVLARRPADALIVDVGLPGIDGYDLVRRLRDSELDAPVLMVTIEDRQDLPADLAVHGWLGKPFGRAALDGAVHALVAGP